MKLSIGTDQLDKTRHLVIRAFPKLIPVLSVSSGRLVKEMVKRAKEASHLSRNSLETIQSEIRTRRLSTNPVNS